MSEFPALRDALVGAATRRRRRRRLTGAAAPVLALAAAVAFLAVPQSSPERELLPVVTTPSPVPLSPLEQAFGIFRRPQAPEDVVPGSKVIGGEPDAAKSRLIATLGPERVFAVPTVLRGEQSLCVVRVRRAGGGSGCSPLKDVLRDDFASGVWGGSIYTLLLRDGAHDVVLALEDGTRLEPSIRENAVIVQTKSHVGRTSWTSASETRYIQDNIFDPGTRPLPTSCPGKLAPLPSGPIAKARRAALLAVEEFYPGIESATVTRAQEFFGSPCGKRVSGRSIAVTLALVPRSPAARKDPKRTKATLLLATHDGALRVYNTLR
jgi:hypothetical protein